MARFFSEHEIDGFRDCFYLNCKSGVINDIHQLKVVMRSCGFSPTINELGQYLQQRGNNIKFADFLDCCHQHSQIEKIPEEIKAAFRGAGIVKDGGMVDTEVLRNLLCNSGEKMSHEEYNAFLRENNIVSPQIPMKKFVDLLHIPKPSK